MMKNFLILLTLLVSTTASAKKILVEVEVRADHYYNCSTYAESRGSHRSIDSESYEVSIIGNDEFGSITTWSQSSPLYYRTDPGVDKIKHDLAKLSASVLAALQKQGICPK